MKTALLSLQVQIHSIDAPKMVLIEKKSPTKDIELEEIGKKT